MTVTVDRRELVISRLSAILEGLTITLSNGVIPAGHFVHNRNELPASLVPGIILLDADEVHNPRALPLAPGRELNRMQVQVMQTTPEIYIVLDVRKPANTNVGEDLNKARLAILAAIIQDSELQQILGANGSMTYDGCVTDLARNRKMEGQMGLSFTFGYPLLPGEVAGR